MFLTAWSLFMNHRWVIIATINLRMTHVSTHECMRRRLLLAEWRWFEGCLWMNAVYIKIALTSQFLVVCVCLVLSSIRPRHIHSRSSVSLTIYIRDLFFLFMFSISSINICWEKLFVTHSFLSVSFVSNNDIGRTHIAYEIVRVMIYDYLSLNYCDL